MDIHSPEGATVVYMHLKEGTDYDIPYRCLYSRKVSNLLVAGRCISSTHEANAAVRVSPIAMATGQAAGVVASIAALNSITPWEVDISILRGILIEQDACV